MSGRVLMEQDAKSFSTSPKLAGYDMVILNIDENTYVSSPYAKIVDESKWATKGNGKYEFAYDLDTGKWKSGSTVYTADELLESYGIELYFYSEETEDGFSDKGKVGDTITVVLARDSDPDANEKMNLSLQCQLTRSGSTLETSCPLSKQSDRQTIADNLLKKMYNYSYQPFTATEAVIDPAAELGDGITAYGVYSGIYQQDLTFNTLMASNISAPVDEEVDEEMEYKESQDRIYSRHFAEIAAEFMIKSDEIEARVTKEGTGDGFSWSLVYDAFTIKKGSQEVMKVDGDGLTVRGTVYATAGKFEGEIQVGNNFKVDSAGNMSANSATLTGTLTIGGQTITAAELRYGAQKSYDNNSSWDAAFTSTADGGYCNIGSGYGYNYNKAEEGTRTPENLHVNVLWVNRFFVPGAGYFRFVKSGSEAHLVLG